jgi:hypothetical protein
MISRAMAAMALVAIASCAPSLEAFNENGGVIRHTQAGSNMAGVLEVADKYCRQIGRSGARLTSSDIFWSDTVTFECVQ